MPVQYTRPAAHIDWGTAPVTDATTGQSSVVEPPGASKATGFVPFRVKPPRNWMNWLFQRIDQWLKYHDGSAQRSATFVVAAIDAAAESIRKADYLCDGVADDVQINEALTALGVVGGKVILTEGTFTIAASIQLASRHALLGQGDATVLRAATNVANYSVVRNANQGADTDTDLMVADLRIDGNRAAQTTASHVGVHLQRVARARIERVRVHDVDNNGAGTGHGVQLVDCDQAIVERVHVRDCTGDGFNLSESDALAVPRNLVMGCHAISCTGAGFRSTCNHSMLDTCYAAGCAAGDFIVSGNLASLSDCFSQSSGAAGFQLQTGIRLRLTGCRANGSAGHGIHVNGPNECQIVGCYVDGATQSGIGLTTAHDALVDGNRMQNNGTSAGTHSDIRIEGSDRASISNNQCRNPGAGGGRVTYAVHVTDALSDNCFVHGNDLQQGQVAGNAGVGIQNDGTGTVGLPVGTLTNSNRQY